jgi:tetratricopeptide (TPR) repeat protein
MKKSFWIIPFLFFSLQLHAQTRDSITSLIQQYDFQGALQVINALRPDSTDPETMYLKATALKALSRYREAISCLEELYQTDSSDLRSALELADCYRAVSNFEKPQDIYENTLVWHPENRYLLHLIAGTCMNNGQYARALEYYSTACAGDTTAFLLKQMAACCEKTGRIDSAILFYNKAIDRDPDDYQPVFRLATLYKSLDDYESGILVTDLYLDRYPDNLDVNRLNGYLQYLMRNFSRSAERFQHCSDLKDTSAFINKYLGYSYFRMNKYDRTVEYLGKVLGTGNADAEMYYVMGLCYDVPVNIAYFDTTIRMVTPAVSFLSEVYQYMALALTKTAAYDSALTMLLRARELTPDDIQLLNKIGTHYDNWMENKPMALKYYRDFLSARSAGINQTTSDEPVFDFEAKMVEDRIRELELRMPTPVIKPDTMAVDTAVPTPNPPPSSP